MMRKSDLIPSTGYLTAKLLTRVIKKLFEQMDSHSDSGISPCLNDSEINVLLNALEINETG
jgi:hypothetical protein